MDKVIRIGTRESQLALWQAEHVRQQLAAAGVRAELVGVTSEGDQDLTTPLYALGVQGVFTRSLDAALVAGRIDIAVHSLKDVPTVAARGTHQAAVLPRGPVKDLLVWRKGEVFPDDRQAEAVIATGSVRRKAQWLHRFPHHHIVPLRGNVNTRLEKLEHSSWAGAVFAAAGLQRIGLRPANARELDWMLPAPAQGAIVIVCQEEDPETRAIASGLNDPDTALCTRIERDFLATLQGGCSTPISAYAHIEAGQLIFEGNIVSPDGTKKLEIQKTVPLAAATRLGEQAAKELLERGATEILTLLKTPPAP